MVAAWLHSSSVRAPVAPAIWRFARSQSAQTVPCPRQIACKLAFFARGLVVRSTAGDEMSSFSARFTDFCRRSSQRMVIDSGAAESGGARSELRVVAEPLQIVGLRGADRAIPAIPLPPVVKEVTLGQLLPAPARSVGGACTGSALARLHQPDLVQVPSQIARL
jgi:hypothetical protein